MSLPKQIVERGLPGTEIDLNTKRINLTGEALRDPTLLAELGAVASDTFHEDRVSLDHGRTPEGDEVRVLRHSDTPDQPVAAEIRLAS